jgi:hypothetical protein
MLYPALADAVVVVHLGFVLFVLSGGFLALRWRRLMLLHLPSAAWGALVEIVGWECPLTPLENWLRLRGGEVAYRGGFVDHYLLPVLYPEPFPGRLGLLLGGVVLAVNAVAYSALLRRMLSRRRASGKHGSPL